MDDDPRISVVRYSWKVSGFSKENVEKFWKDPVKIGLPPIFFSLLSSVQYVRVHTCTYICTLKSFIRVKITEISCSINTYIHTCVPPPQSHLGRRVVIVMYVHVVCPCCTEYYICNVHIRSIQH